MTKVIDKIGLAFLTKEDYDKATESFQQELAIVEKVYGKANPITASAYSSMMRYCKD
jgi:hypothetical protein